MVATVQLQVYAHAYLDIVAQIAALVCVVIA